MISTHAPAGGATYWEILFEQWDAFLLTPLREGRRTILFSICSALHISTHAPAGGATGDFELLTGSKYLFLLTPLREGRRPSGGPCLPRRGAQISTHAPAGGATRLMGQGHWEVRLHFYSRPCGRGDSESTRTVPLYGSFLLTPLREGRPILHRNLRRCGFFYSRPCGRGDELGRQAVHHVAEVISTHAPAGGATENCWSTEP